MRKVWLVGLVLLAALLVGCDARWRVDVDIPIVIEPQGPRYSAELDGYLSYDDWTEHVKYTASRNRSSYYRPLANAKVTVEETGRVAYTDRTGYFYLDRLPYGRLTLIVQHQNIRGRLYIQDVWSR